MEATMTLLQLWLTFTLWFRGSIQPSAVRTNSTPPSNTLKLATFNIRFGWPQDPLNEQRYQDFDQERPWYKRREGLLDQVIWEEPDVIGFQEVGAHFLAITSVVSSSQPPLPCRSSIINLMI
jgi:hypothetical protein